MKIFFSGYRERGSELNNGFSREAVKIRNGEHHLSGDKDETEITFVVSAC